MTYINTEDLVTISDAAKELDLTTSWLYTLIQREEINAVKIGGKKGYWFLLKDEVERIRQSQEKPKKENAAPTRTSR